MKVSITGHSRGLGKALFKRYPNAVGISTKECDINNVDQVLEFIQTSDIFINNAYSGFKQTEILAGLFELWKYENKTIVNIVSRSKYPNISKGYLYSASKASLSHLSNSLRFISDKKCRIIDINPGLLQSDLPSLAYEEVADIVQYAISLPFHIEIGELSVWNTTPYSVVSNLKDLKK